MGLTKGGSVTIANNASLSGAMSLGEGGIVGIYMPADWTAASLTFAAALSEDGTFNPVYDQDGTELTVAADADRYIVLNPADFAGIRFMKIRSGTSGSAVTQGGARVLEVITRPI